MGLVDCEGRDTEAPRELQESGSQQALGGDEHQVMAAGFDLLLGAANVGEIHAAVQRCRRIAAGAQRVDLILHQRDQR